MEVETYNRRIEAERGLLVLSIRRVREIAVADYGSKQENVQNKDALCGGSILGFGLNGGCESVCGQSGIVNREAITVSRNFHDSTSFFRLSAEQTMEENATSERGCHIF